MLTLQRDVLQLWEEDAELFSHSMETDDPFRSRAESLLLTLLEVNHSTVNTLPCSALQTVSMLTGRMVTGDAALGHVLHQPRSRHGLQYRI